VNHTRPCGKNVDVRSLHGLACRRSTPRQQRHTHVNDILWRSIKRAQLPEVKEPVSLVRQDGKQPDGVTLLPWARGKPLAWHITVPDTYAKSHLHDTACRQAAAADKAAANKSSKYRDLAGTHLFFPVAIETAGTWNQMAVELVQKIGRLITLVTEDTRETVFLFHRLFIALQRGNAVSFHSTFTTK